LARITDHSTTHYVHFSTLLSSLPSYAHTFSNTLSLRFFLKACDQVSQPYKTTSKITVPYFGQKTVT
jgi:hypothetical protein